MSQSSDSKDNSSDMDVMQLLNRLSSESVKDILEDGLHRYKQRSIFRSSYSKNAHILKMALIQGLNNQRIAQQINTISRTLGLNIEVEVLCVKESYDEFKKAETALLKADVEMTVIGGWIVQCMALVAIGRFLPKEIENMITDLLLPSDPKRADGKEANAAGSGENLAAQGKGDKEPGDEDEGDEGGSEHGEDAEGEDSEEEMDGEVDGEEDGNEEEGPEEGGDE